MNVQLSQKDSSTFKHFRSSIQASLTHLDSLEKQARAPRSRPTTPRHSKQARFSGVPPPTPLQIANVCTTCGTPGCHYTECPKGRYVFDTHSVARPFAPGEPLSHPASWQDIHRANLQGILRLVGQYYYQLHKTPRHLENARVIVSTSLGFSVVPPPSETLLHQAISEVATRLRADPLSLATPSLFASQCACFHTPVFGISLSQFQDLVNKELL
jgi:hypothetical protein